MQNKFEFIPRRDFAIALDMEFGKIYTCNLSTDAFVIKENFYLCLLSLFLSENSNDFILTGFYRSLYHGQSLLNRYCA